MSKEFVLPQGATFSEATASTKIMVVGYVTHDGPMTDYADGSAVRQSTLVRFELWELVGGLNIQADAAFADKKYNEWSLVYSTPKVDAVPYMGAGSSVEMFIKSIGYHAELWHNDLKNAQVRSRTIHLCKLALRLAGRRFMPSGFTDPIDETLGSFADNKTFYFINEFKIGDVSVWVKRRLNKNLTVSTRWSFIETFDSPNIEMKFTYSEHTLNQNDRPKTFQEVCASVPQLEQRFFATKVV